MGADGHKQVGSQDSDEAKMRVVNQMLGAVRGACEACVKQERDTRDSILAHIKQAKVKKAEGCGDVCAVIYGVVGGVFPHAPIPWGTFYFSRPMLSVARSMTMLISPCLLDNEL